MIPARRPHLFAVVPCAGRGERAGTALPKQYESIHDEPLVAHTLRALLAVRRLDGVLVVVGPGDELFHARVPGEIVERCWVHADGGATRAATVMAGLRALRQHGAQDGDWVLVHDAARCLIQPAAVERLIEACEADAVGGLLALPVADTLKRARDDGGTPRVQATLAREGVWSAQTPQMFRLGLLERALAQDGGTVTDESSAVEVAGLQPMLVRGDAGNLKVTWPEDFGRAAQVLAERARAAAPTASPKLRIGEGWDVHQLVVGRPLVLGGVTIPHTHGLLGHSDADALLHAITDAVLGAAALGDIGRHFPDTAAEHAGADSAVLLERAMDKVRAAGWRPLNLDATITAQAPKMAPHIPAMVRRIAPLLGLAPDAVNVKAKTAEKLGPVGEGRSIEARAVVLMTQI